MQTVDIQAALKEREESLQRLRDEMQRIEEEINILAKAASILEQPIGVTPIKGSGPVLTEAAAVGNIRKAFP